MIAADPALSEQQLAYRKQVTAWIGDLERRFNVTRQEIALRARIQPSTIYRWFDDRLLHVPSHASVLRIANSFNVPMPGDENPYLTGVNEGDVAPWTGPEPGREDSPSVSRWRLESRALELFGYVPGDVLVVDQSLPARNGDAVAAQVFNRERATNEIRIRKFDAPYLVCATMDPSVEARPLYVDGDNTIVLGPVIRMFRIRE